MVPSTAPDANYKRDAIDNRPLRTDLLSNFVMQATRLDEKMVPWLCTGTIICHRSRVNTTMWFVFTPYYM